MKCNILLKEAINGSIVSPEERAALNAAKPKAVSGYVNQPGVGIDINSKLNTALMKINEQLFKQSGNYGSRINKQTLYKRLQAEGVSKKEIELVLKDILSKQPKKLSIREKQLLKMLSPDEAAKLGVYKSDGITKTVSLANVRDWAAESRPQIKTISDTSYAGYTYDMQGQHNPTYQIRGLNAPNIKESGAPNHFPGERGLLGWSRSYIGKQPGIEGKVLRLDEFQSDWAQDPKIQQALGDFPIDHNDFKKLMIVDGLDRTLKEGLDTMVIPITRTLNNLVGTKEVSQVYRDLNIGILPKIRQELGKSGLLLDIKHVKRDTDTFDMNKFTNRLFEIPEADLAEGVRDHFRNLVDMRADEVGNIKGVLEDALDHLLETMDVKPSELRVIRKVIDSIETEQEEAFILKLKDKAGRDFKAVSPKGYTADGIPTKEKFQELKEVLYKKAKLGTNLADTDSIYVDAIADLEEDTITKYFPDFDGKGNAKVGQIKKLLADPYVISREDDSTLDAISEALTHQDYIQSKQGAIPYDTIIANLRMTPYDNVADIENIYSYYKELIPDLPEFYKSPGKFKQYRWDALSVAAALGLGEAYNKLQEQAN